MKILIAGSTSGMGRAIAESCLLNNDQVIGLARNHQKFNPHNKNYLTYSIDFSKISDIEEQFKKIKKEVSDIDAIICSIGYGDFAELEQYSVKRMQNLLNVNFLSQAILIKTFLADFKKRKSGKIILIGSECALQGEKKATMYAATKFALRGFTQSLRKECANASIGITLINPGVVRTPFFDDLSFHPAADPIHSIDPVQIASLVSLLLKEENNCVYEEINLQPMTKKIEKK